ncbi:hypothetical protein LTR10_017177 [Elasticomyces elasticus]|uniref:Xylanolytic transcriptional activator regulatory domain-containing protein n=1 Tax=Exophiala sideris TaxID=1016849 RepID=A0ABR0J5M5_9EURO|nr:hypothetical protein LTR10_017177 [Elasticomyces elasticus]KAK5028467.1 hypothetical protein LTS07_006558 [Exophiala sideris]KAK5035891.1 hypothetical protein LTR13_005461 [Exophiala sideris]KAK5056927.1 hypothetical protein LTR69_007565 [Exophiala sideris]KAK5181334.1 hypothetical protein LTR44_006129 [Eurotiomycetes sp. CCFEE 6388]
MPGANGLGDTSQKQHLHGQFGELVFAANEPILVQQDKQAIARKSSMSTSVLDSVTHAGLTESSAPSTFPPAFDSRQMPLPQGGQLGLDMDTINSVSGEMPPGSFGNPAMAGQFENAFVGGTSAYDYTSFDEPLNWIPPSIYPSPYDAELEQDFSFILPPLSGTPNLGTDYNIPLALDSTTQIFQIPTNITQDVSGNQAFPSSLMGLDQSPSSSGSDSMNTAKLNNTSSTASETKRKKRKASFIPDLFDKPRREQTAYAFPDPSESTNTVTASEVQDYCLPATYEVIVDRFKVVCLATESPFARVHHPDMATLNHCLNLYFDHFQPTCPLVHQPSFGPSTHWLVVLAVAAIGSTFSKASHALDLREAFQEFLRRAVQRVADGIPDDPLDISLAQARILNLIGLVQSDRDQLRSQAPRYHADLSRWCLESGVLQLSDIGDSVDAELIHGHPDQWQSWQKWTRVETLRRIGYLAWMMDCCLGYMANARPLCNMDDARTPLPCAESAWNASSPESWAQIISNIPETPSLCAAIETLYNKKKIDPSYSELSQTLLIHALYQRTWEVGTHIKQPLSEWVPTGKARGFLNTPSKDNFWLPLYPLYANWRNSACDCLDVLNWQASSVVANASGVEHGVMLHLHLARIILLTPFQEIQDLTFSLVGKVGNSAKASFYVHDGSYQPRNSAKLPQIRKITWRWLREDQHKARLAMIHAGSVFWYVRRYSATSFFEPIAVYLATLVLWTYGSYKSTALERDAAAASQKPEGGPSGPDAGAAIQPSRVERKERPVKFMNKAAGQADNAAQIASTSPRTKSLSDADDINMSPNTENGLDPSASSPVQSYDSEGDETSSSNEQPEFIHLDRPCDDEMVQHFVRNGHNMSGHMSNVGDICKTPQKVLLEGAKLLRTRLSCWGVSREYYDILTKLAELRKAG